MRENGTTRLPTRNSTPAPLIVSTSTLAETEDATSSSTGSTSAALSPVVAVNVRWVRSPPSGAFAAMPTLSGAGAASASFDAATAAVVATGCGDVLATSAGATGRGDGLGAAVDVSSASAPGISPAGLTSTVDSTKLMITSAVPVRCRRARQLMPQVRPRS